MLSVALSGVVSSVSEIVSDGCGVVALGTLLPEFGIALSWNKFVALGSAGAVTDGRGVFFCISEILPSMVYSKKSMTNRPTSITIVNRMDFTIWSDIKSPPISSSFSLNIVIRLRSKYKSELAKISNMC